jgi:hypothetical protein
MEEDGIRASTWMKDLKRWFRTMANPLREFFYGMAQHEFELQIKKEKIERENVLGLYLFGDLLGLPLSHRYYALRLLPYFVPKLAIWKRRLLREKDLTEMGGMDF